MPLYCTVLYCTVTRREYEVLHLTPGGPVYVFTQSALHYDLGDTSSSQDYDYLSFQSKVRREYSSSAKRKE